MSILGAIAITVILLIVGLTRLGQPSVPTSDPPPIEPASGSALVQKPCFTRVVQATVAGVTIAQGQGFALTPEAVMRFAMTYDIQEPVNRTPSEQAAFETALSNYVVRVVAQGGKDIGTKAVTEGIYTDCNEPRPW